MYTGVISYDFINNHPIFDYELNFTSGVVGNVEQTEVCGLIPYEQVKCEITAENSKGLSESNGIKDLIRLPCDGKLTKLFRGE